MGESPSFFRQDPHAERGDELQDDGARHIGDALRQAQHAMSQQEAHHRAANHGERQDGGARAGKRGAHRGSHRQAINQQRRGVVQQAFALQDHHDSMRNVQPAHHRRGRHRVRRRDDGADGNARGPGHVRHQVVNQPGDCGRRDAHRDEHQRHHRNPVALEIPQRGVEGRIEQGRCDEQCQRELRIQVERRRVRDEGQRGAAERQQRGVGQLEIARAAREQHGADEQDQQRLKQQHGAACYAKRGEGRGALLSPGTSPCKVDATHVFERISVIH